MVRPLTWLVALLFAILPLGHVPALRNVLALGATAWVVVILLRERRVPLPAWPMAVWIALGTASALWSPDARATLHSVLYEMLLPAGAFLAAWRVAAEGRGFDYVRWGAAAGMLLLASIVAVAASTGALPALLPDAQAGGLLRYWPGVGVASTFAALAAPFALIAVASRQRPHATRGAVVLAALVAVALATQNRVVWPTLLLTGAAFMAWLWPTLAVPARRMALVLLLAATAAGWGAFQYVSSERNPLIPAMETVSGDSRLQAWREWIGMAAEKPLIGHGFGKPILNSLGKEGLSASVKERDRYLTSHAHNVLLDVAVQLGALGLLSYLALLAALVWAYWSLGGRHSASEARLLGAAGAALVVAMLAKNSTDSFMGHAVVLGFWGYAGSLLGALEARRSSRSKAS